MPTITTGHLPDSPPSRSHPATLTVHLEVDPLRVRHGHPIDSGYVEAFWLSHLGPSSVCVLRTIARMTEPGSAITIPYAALAAIVGVGASNAKHAPLGRTLDRLVRFGAARWASTDRREITVWSHVAPVPLRLRERWPDWLQATHDRAVTEAQGR